MKEIIDKKNQIKMMALPLCGVRYESQEYLIYSIKRNHDEVNIFVSKLVHTSSGYKIDYHFENGEKNLLENIVHKIFNHEPILKLAEDGLVLIKDIELVGTNYFDVDECYITTVSNDVMKSCITYYDFISHNQLDVPIMEVKDDKKIHFNQIYTILVIIFGIFILVFCIYFIFQIIF